MARRPPTRRHERIGEAIKRTLMKLKGEGALDSISAAQYSFTEVRPTTGYEAAVVFVSALDQGEQDSVVAALNARAAEVRYALAGASRLRTTPELKFKSDASDAYAARIDELLAKE